MLIRVTGTSFASAQLLKIRAATKTLCAMKRSLSIFAILTMCACGTIDFDSTNGGNSSDGDVADISILQSNESDDSFDLNDYTNTVTICYDGSQATVTKSADIESLTVSRDGAYVTVGDSGTELKNLRIILSGSTTSGNLKVYNSKKFVLELNGVSITSARGAAVNNQCPKTMFVQLNTGTVNSLCDASSYSDVVSGEDCNAALFSEGQMVFEGEGSLSVTARYKHAISSDDYIRVDGGNITVPSAAGDGIHVNDYYYQTGGSMNIKAVDEGVQVEKGFFNITGGSLTISTSGTKGEGIEAASDIYIQGGSTYVYSAKDDAVNSGGSIIVSDGYLFAYASSNDALDSNAGKSGAITITGGVVIAHGANSPEEAFDCDNHSYIRISGGTVFGTGGTQSGGSFTASQYGSVISGSVSTGYFTVTDADGNVIMCCKVPRIVSNSSTLVSSPSFESGGSYKYSVLSSRPEGSSAVFGDYYYTGGTASAATSFSVSTTYTFSGGGGGGFPGGGGGPGRH